MAIERHLAIICRIAHTKLLFLIIQTRSSRDYNACVQLNRLFTHIPPHTALADRVGRGKNTCWGCVRKEAGGWEAYTEKASGTQDGHTAVGFAA